MLRAPMSEVRFPCPACGHLVFAEPPGSDDICLVCLWEDDLTQLRWPELAGGKNEVSLAQAQRNVATLGAIEERFAEDVRPPTEEEPLDPAWRANPNAGRLAHFIEDGRAHASSPLIRNSSR
jgi:Cysteine-rich CPCC